MSRTEQLYAAFTPATSFSTEAFASPNSIAVFGP
jgi:hypothetical protein